MRRKYEECKHCGTDIPDFYFWEHSNISREYQDNEYCLECKKAIVDALKKIPVKFAYEDVKTDEVDLDTLLRWEKEHKEEIDAKGGLHFTRVLVGCRNLKTGEHDVVREVIGREDKEGRVYIYSYWSSAMEDKSQQRITVERRVELATGEPGRYKIKDR